MRESEIIAGCLKADRTAQHALYKMFGARVMGVCKRYMKDKERAEEMAMNAFLTIFQKIGQFKNEGSFEGWILRISANACLMELRKKTHFSIETDMGNLPDEPSLDADFFEDDIAKILSILPEGARIVFNMYAIEGYKHSEIAEILSISEGTSKSQLHYAKEKLRQKFSQFQPKKTAGHE